MLGNMLLPIKIALLTKGIRQVRMAVDIGIDPAKLSRIVNGYTIPTVEDRHAIANYLGRPEDELFAGVPLRRNGRPTNPGGSKAWGC